MKIQKYTLLAIFLWVSLNCTFGQDAMELSKSMLATVKTIHSLKYRAESNERINGKMRFENANFKMQVQPFKIYVYQIEPKKGIECLFVTGQNNGKVKVNPGSFPWVSLNLQADGDLILENRHHMLFDAGFGYTTSVLEYLLNKYSAQSEKLLTLHCTEKMLGSDCYHLVFVNPNYKLTLYTTTKEETLVSIAQKLHINFYSIIENNSGLTAGSTVKPNTRLIVPNDYASKMEIWIHKEKKHPVCLKVYDTKGLYEEYKFYNVEINYSVRESDFSEKNPEYKFK
jgi:hypothetical protein